MTPATRQREALKAVEELRESLYHLNTAIGEGDDIIRLPLICGAMVGGLLRIMNLFGIRNILPKMEMVELLIRSQEGKALSEDEWEKLDHLIMDYKDAVGE
jgi:hypothetical protein